MADSSLSAVKSDTQTRVDLKILDNGDGTFSHAQDAPARTRVNILDAGGLVTYYGFAAPGKLPSDAAWLVFKRHYDGSGNFVADLPAGTGAYDQVLDDYATLDYNAAAFGSYL